jgi:hypothetical protein
MYYRTAFGTRRPARRPDDDRHPQGEARRLCTQSLSIKWAQPVPAQHSECTGDKVTITYATTRITGLPTLTVQLGNTTITRSGDDIHTEDTVLGSLMTIVRRTIPDLLTSTLTLLIPAVNLTAHAPDVTFTTTSARSYPIEPPRACR